MSEDLKEYVKRIYLENRDIPYKDSVAQHLIDRVADAAFISFEEAAEALKAVMMEVEGMSETETSEIVEVALKEVKAHMKEVEEELKEESKGSS